jgi:hypothetical protein
LDRECLQRTGLRLASDGDPRETSTEPPIAAQTDDELRPSFGSDRTHSYSLRTADFRYVLYFDGRQAQSPLQPVFDEHDMVFANEEFYAPAAHGVDLLAAVRVGSGQLTAVQQELLERARKQLAERLSAAGRSVPFMQELP